MVTILTVALAVTATVLCIHFKWFTDLPLSIMGTVLFFPISFGFVRRTAPRTTASMLSPADASHFATTELISPLVEEKVC